MNRGQLKRRKEMETEMILTEAAGETFEPFAPSQVHRSCAAASIATTQGSMRRPGRGTADGRHHRADVRPRALRLSNDHRTAEQLWLASEPQAGRADMAAPRPKGFRSQKPTPITKGPELFPPRLLLVHCMAETGKSGQLGHRRTSFFVPHSLPQHAQSARFLDSPYSRSPIDIRGFDGSVSFEFHSTFQHTRERTKQIPKHPG